MRQKKILCSLIILIVITILAAGTMAYFTATESIRNKFMIAGYDPCLLYTSDAADD